MSKGLSSPEIGRVIEMAWEDRTPFGAIEAQFGLAEKDVIALMRRQLKRGSFELWRKRVSGRGTKHRKKAGVELTRFVCPTQGKHR